MRSLPLAAAVAATLLASACSKKKPPAQPSQTAPQAQATSASKEPSQKEIAAEIAKAGVTQAQATRLFTMAVGPLPGIAASAGERDTTDFDGTLAVGYLYQVWDSLTPDQRRAAAQLIQPASAQLRNGTRAAAATNALPFRFASFVATGGDSDAFDFRTMIQNANGTLSAFLSVPAVGTTFVVNYGTPEGTEYAHTTTWWRPFDSPLFDYKVYPDGKCHITIWNQRFQALDETAAEAVLTHEVFHCYQQRVAGTAANMMSIHPWIVEGEPTWVMVAVFPAVNGTIIDTKWTPYVFGPKTVYSSRSYDALGVFGHESDIAGDADVWPKLLPMVAAGEQGDDQTPFSMLIKGRESSYYTSWGSSYFEAQGQTPWMMVGPGDPPTSGPSPDAISVQAGTQEMLAPVPSYEAQLWQLDGDADIVIVSLFTGYGRLHDSGFDLDTDLGTGGALALCLKDGGCKCPDGSPGASLVTKPAHSPISIGADGGDVTAQVGVAGKSLDDFCKKPDPTQPNPPGNGGGGGGGAPQTPDSSAPALPPDGGITLGDPHLMTFDGVYYDMQVKGELTLVRSTKDNFTVQVRQVPVVGSRDVTVNSAMATMLGRDTVMISVEQHAPLLRINGKAVAGAVPVLKGGTIARYATMFGEAYRLTWPDGTLADAVQGGDFLTVHVVPAASRRGTLVGLLGDYDGSPDNDLVGLHQAKLGVRPSSDDITHSLADAWRITQAQSLFTYKPGQSTATFTDHNYPLKAIDPSTVANRASAEAYCKSLQITDQHLLDNCVLDLAVSNDFVFGSEYAHAQQVLAARLAIAGPPKAATGPQRIVVMTGEILDSKSEPEFKFEGNKDDVIWIHGDTTCVDRVPNNHPVGFRLFDPTGKEIPGPGDMGCGFGRRELPVTGTYTFKGYFGYQNEITRWRVPIHFVRPDRHFTLAYGQIVSGNIEQRAARDIYTFSAQAGDILRIAGPGCNQGDMLITVYDSLGHEQDSPSCRVDSRATVKQTGTYQLMINSWDGGPAAYHFVFQGGTFK